MANKKTDSTPGKPFMAIRKFAFQHVKLYMADTNSCLPPAKPVMAICRNQWPTQKKIK